MPTPSPSPRACLVAALVSVAVVSAALVPPASAHGVPVASPATAPAPDGGDTPAEVQPYEQVVDLTFPTDRRATYHDDYESPRSRGAHGATDLMGTKGWGVFAAVGGRVTSAPGSDGTPPPSYGYMVRIAGNDGRQYAYLHLNNDTPGTDDGKGGPELAYAPGVVKGATVTRGQLIGYMGDSGNAESTAPHLHFEIDDPTVTDPGGTHRINPWSSLNDARARGDYPTATAPAWPPAGWTGPSTVPGKKSRTVFAPSGAREVDDSCPTGAVPGRAFADVAPGSAHHATVACAVWWELTKGATPQVFDPERNVTRAQMATFLARLVTAGGATLPSDAPDRFGDDDGSAHEANIDRVVAAGIMAGVGKGRFGPRLPVTRAEMARYLVAAYEHAAATTLPPAADAFGDDEGDPDEAHIDRAAAVGFASGVTASSYAPGREVTRGQVSSFLARVLDLLVEVGTATTP